MLKAIIFSFLVAIGVFALTKIFFGTLEVIFSAIVKRELEYDFTFWFTLISLDVGLIVYFSMIKF